MNSCEILAEVTVNGLVFLGESPVAGTYLCAASVTNPATASMSPYICTGIMSATELGVILASSSAAQSLLNKAIEHDCNIIVDVSDKTIKFVAYQVKNVSQQTKRSLTETKRTFSAINTPEGIMWLMNYLSRR